MENDFITIDFETANQNRNSICQVGLCRFGRDGKIETWGSLINPEVEFSKWNSKIHKITAEEVADSPTFPVIYPDLLTKIKGNLVVSYTDFDRSCFLQTIDRYDLPKEPICWLDGSILIREIWPKFSEKYALKNVAEHFGIAYQHHDAIDDSRVAGELINIALQQSNSTIDQWYARYGQIIQPDKKINSTPAKKVVIDGYHHSSEIFNLIKVNGYEIKRDIVYGVDLLIVDALDQDTPKLSKAHRYIENGAKILIATTEQFLANPTAEFVDQVVPSAEPLQKKPEDTPPAIEEKRQNNTAKSIPPSNKNQGKRTGCIIGLAIVAIILVIIALAVTSGQDRSTATRARCLPATQQQLDFITAGISALENDNSIGKVGWAIKSNDFENVYMVAVMIYGPGMETGTGPGIWAIGGDPESPNMTLSVNGFAKEFSTYPDASKTDAQITLSADGVDAVQKCFEE